MFGDFTPTTCGEPDVRVGGASSLLAWVADILCAAWVRVWRRGAISTPVSWRRRPGCSGLLFVALSIHIRTPAAQRNAELRSVRSFSSSLNGRSRSSLLGRSMRALSAARTSTYDRCGFAAANSRRRSSPCSHVQAEPRRVALPDVLDDVHVVVRVLGGRPLARRGARTRAEVSSEEAKKGRAND